METGDSSNPGPLFCSGVLVFRDVWIPQRVSAGQASLWDCPPWGAPLLQGVIIWPTPYLHLEEGGEPLPQIGLGVTAQVPVETVSAARGGDGSK